MTLLGATLRSRREELGLGQDDVARKLGVSQQTVSRWENGDATPRPSRVLELAELFQLDPPQLQQLAGILPPPRSTPLNGDWKRLYDGIHDLSRADLLMLIERAWTELRRRDGHDRRGSST
jgi:transcriptional regulator with XRE-family HTH domain